MTPERWQQIEALYHAAAGRPQAERTAFLADACAGDDALRQEIESLLGEPVSGDGFAGGPEPLDPLRFVTDMAADRLIGHSFGDYHLQALIGAGGMGEVYRAHDARLDRDVAIKILPAAFTSDPDRLARFEREARMLAALNHPNICAIYGVEEVAGTRFLILELLEGETLAEAVRRSANRDGLPLAEALGFARQIAEALETAHDKGIVHRDLKPANIIVTPHGVVKVLDFGLAKAVARSGSSPDLTDAPVAEPGRQRQGHVMGTAAYMSPEQARGFPVDKRTDIWAFGCVLYEMLSGRAAFFGDTISDTIARILEREPDWSLLPVTTPAAVRRLLFRCLAKDAKQRLRDIGDARIEIDGLDAVPSGEIGHRPARSTPSRLLSVAALALVALVAAIAGWNLRAVPPASVVRFTHTLPAGQTLNGSRGARIVAISPDGAQVAYSGMPYGLFIGRLVELEPRIVPGTETYEVSDPVFSPDGESIAFFTIADETLKRIPVAGGAAQTLCSVKVPSGLIWSPEGILFGQGSGGIQKVSPEGGTPDVLVSVTDTEWAHGPQVLPGGEHLLFTRATGHAPNRWDKARIVVHALKTGEQKVLIEDASDAHYLPTGHIVYAVGGNLYAVAFDRRRLAVTGQRVAVIEGVRRAAGSFTGAAAFDVSVTGSLVYVPGPGGSSPAMDLGLMNRRGEVQPLKLPPGPYSLPRLSPSGAHVAFESDDGSDAAIYTYDLSGANAMQRLTSAGNNHMPLWVSNDRVVYQSDRGGDLAMWWQPLDGEAERLTSPVAGTAHEPESWFGDTLLYSVTDGSEVSLWTLSMTTRRSVPYGNVRSSSPTGAALSPDGRWVAYATADRGKTTLYVEPFPSTGIRYPLTARVSDTPKHPRWSRDGTELFYNPNVATFESVRITQAPFGFGKAVAVPKRVFGGPVGSRTPYDITPDGRLIGLITAGQTSFVRGSDTQIVVVLNWFDALKAHVPVR